MHGDKEWCILHIDIKDFYYNHIKIIHETKAYSDLEVTMLSPNHDILQRSRRNKDGDFTIKDDKLLIN